MELRQVPRGPRREDHQTLGLQRDSGLRRNHWGYRGSPGCKVRGRELSMSRALGAPASLSASRVLPKPVGKMPALPGSWSQLTFRFWRRSLGNLGTWEFGYFYYLWVGHHSSLHLVVLRLCRQLRWISILRYVSEEPHPS